MYERSSGSPIMIMALFGPHFIGSSNRHGLESQNVQKFIHSEDQHFDLIVIEDIFHDSFLMLGHKFKAPTVAICMFRNN